MGSADQTSRRPVSEEDEARAARSLLRDYLARHRLKHTRQRDAILEVFLDSGGHVTSEQLHDRVRARHPEIGTATVYRTLKLLVQAGVASSTTFREGVTLYEREDRHHDHLVCVRCGKIIEFESSMIEDAQKEIAKRHRFHLLRHRHELYGYCSDCQQED